MVKLAFYGGEIGGNKILLEDKDTRILLDFGMNFVERSKFHCEPWLAPRDERGLLEFGLLPDIPGLYRFDEREPDVDAVFLSHSHTDHSAYISFLNRKKMDWRLLLNVLAPAKRNLRNFSNVPAIGTSYFDVGLFLAVMAGVFLLVATITAFYSVSRATGSVLTLRRGLQLARPRRAWNKPKPQRCIAGNVGLRFLVTVSSARNAVQNSE